MRLIDADAMIKRLQRRKKQGEINKSLFDFAMCTIMGQQTAYDVDMVVNILQQQAEQYHSRAEKYAVAGVNSEVEHMAGKAASYEYAIEIVKAGVVND